MMQIGSKLRIQGTFTTSNVNADPTTVALKITLPNGGVIAPLMTKSSTGVYYADYIVEQAGVHSVSIDGSGAITATTTSTFFIPYPVIKKS